MHGVMEEHRVVLSYADLSVWCYACENYVHNEVSHNTVSPRWIGERYLQLYKGTLTDTVFTLFSTQKVTVNGLTNS